MPRILPLGNQISENNPFSNHVPDPASAEFVAFIQQQAETLRKVYNQSESGDTQMNWQRLTFQTKDPIATVGSCGRFKHPQYGMIRAIYVQYGELSDEYPRQGGVLGFQERDSFSWVVTNDPAKSSPRCVVGISACYAAITEGWYGWAICEGVNLIEIETTLPLYEAVFADDIRLAGSDFALTLGGNGRPVGFVASTTTQVAGSLAPGTLLIRT